MDEDNTVPPCIARHGPRIPRASVRVIVNQDGPLTVPVIIVPMEDGRESVIERDAYARLMREGYTNQFFYKRNRAKGKGGKLYVHTSHQDRTRKAVAVHHLVYRRTGRVHIGFIDRDPMNLLLSNLGPKPTRFGKVEKPRKGGARTTKRTRHRDRPVTGNNIPLAQ